jgi:hypothetical protein
MKVTSQEIFGSVLSVLRWSREDEISIPSTARS